MIYFWFLFVLDKPVDFASSTVGLAGSHFPTSDVLNLKISVNQNSFWTIYGYDISK